MCCRSVSAAHFLGANATGSSLGAREPPDGALGGRHGSLTRPGSLPRPAAGTWYGIVKYQKYCGELIFAMFAHSGLCKLKKLLLQIRFLWNLLRIFVLTISWPSSNMGHVGSKTRSPGQILGNSSLHSRGYICDLILIKLGQNVCFDNILAKFEYGSFRVKN